MAFVSGISSALRAKEALDRCGVTVSKAAVAKREAVVMNAGDDKRRGFNLFKDDVVEVFLEKAPQRVMGSTQSNSGSAEPQPGEYGYVDPLAKEDKKRTKEEKLKKFEDQRYNYNAERPKPLVTQTEEEAATDEGAVDVSPNVQPGEFGWTGYKELETKPSSGVKIPVKASSEPKSELPDFLADQGKEIEEDEFAGLPDYLKPLPEDKGRSNWNY